jgi:NAD(P)-dependent dehydrogenase (short-subunit alcohol dehydrogenase family)
MTLPDIAALYDLSGKVAVVTGGAEGIGAEIARHLAAAGAAVLIADRNEEGARATAEAIAGAGGKARAQCFDATDETSIVAVFQGVVDAFGRLDIVVNNAGVQNRAYLLDSDTALWDLVQQVNARGTFICVREAAKIMRPAGRGGRIVNISSTGSVHPIMPGLAAYNSSKSAVNALTRSAALELGGDGITVNAIFPGGVATEGAARTPGSPVGGRALAPPILPRGVEKRDIAAMALFLASPQAEAITGQAFVVDAGFLLG